jgi:putative endonuclease
MVPAYLYILECSVGRHYTGIANDLKQRLDQHRRGRVRSTSWRRPVRLVYFEEHESLLQARQREHSLKNGRTRKESIEYMIKTLPGDRLAPFA